VRGARRAWRTAGATRPSGYVLLLAIVVVLNLVGALMVMSASSVFALREYGSSWFFFERQIAWLLLATTGLVVMARVDYHLLRRAVVPMLTLATLMLLAVLVPGIGRATSGSRRWFDLGPLRFQPSEFAKLALLLYSAEVLARRTTAGRDWRRGVRPILGVFGAFAALVMLEPDMGTTIVLGLIVVVLLFVGGVRLGHLGVLGIGAAGVGTMLAIAEPYRRARLLSFVDPFSDKANRGYQVVQSLIALGTGGWTGLGLGASREKWLYLPNAYTDFIFAVIGEELGLIGSLLVVALFVAFLVLGVRAAVRAPDRLGTLLAAGITAWVVGQAVVNMGAVVGVLPVTGVPLPFISFGGTALLATMGATGVLLNIARQGRT
jgi:cell division protein FtsW